MSLAKRPNNQGTDTDSTRPTKALKPLENMECKNGYVNGAVNGKPALVSDKQLLEDLAAGHRLMAAYGFDELHWNHFSAKQPHWAVDDYYITPGDRMFADIHPQHLVRSSVNVTANVLHTACYRACPDALAVCHCHSPAIEAVSCLAEGVMFLSQSSAGFYDRIAYHEWQGYSDDHGEAEHIIRSVKSSPKPCRALMMRNHGAITFGSSVGAAFVGMYYLNRVCAMQLRVLSTGQKIHYPLKSALEHSAKQFDDNEEFQYGGEWPALKTWLANCERGDVPPVIRSNLS